MDNTEKYYKSFGLDRSIPRSFLKKQELNKLFAIPKKEPTKLAAHFYNFEEDNTHQAEILFLPQRPYVFQGSLRGQLLYPQTEPNISDERLDHILQQVNLNKLAVKRSDLDRIEDWSRILSTGEQQRLAFARLFLYQPRYAILDEATSALDSENEEFLYQQLTDLKITYISVSHRLTILKYHQYLLKLEPNQNSIVVPIPQ
jgi:ABC-type uncharacterized transport system fused permease/ATPase subunit